MIHRTQWDTHTNLKTAANNFQSIPTKDNNKNKYNGFMACLSRQLKVNSEKLPEWQNLFNQQLHDSGILNEHFSSLKIAFYISFSITLTIIETIQ